MITNPLISRFAGQPALVEPSMSARFESCLNHVMEHPRAQELMSNRMQGDFWQAEGGWCRPYEVNANGILEIPVKGVLLNGFPYQLYDWATGYDYIWEAFKRGCGDYAIGAIKGIALVCDTPGGMVAGCFVTTDKMLALKAETGVPVWGFAQESAYSAGYAIISVADQIAVSQTGGVGSIGVVTSHTSMAGALEQRGIKITFIFAGKHKVDGNATEDLSDDVKASIQARIDELYQVFVSAVARNRAMEEQAVRNTEAACFTATQAVSNGLADSIGSFDDAMSAFAGFLDDPSDNGDEGMTNQVATVEQAVHEQAVADARAEGTVAGATAERTRISAILTSDEAKDRGALATHLAMNTGMSPDDAKSTLAASATEKPAVVSEAKGGAEFSDAMDAAGGAGVGADASGGGDKQPVNRGADTMALMSQMGLKGGRAPQNKE